MNRKPKAYNPPALPPLSEEQKARLSRLAEADDSTIDYSDSPKATKEQLTSASLYYLNSSVFRN